MIEIRENTYRIYEHNWDAFDKKMTRVSNKCARYGINLVIDMVEEDAEAIVIKEGTKRTVNVRYRDYYIKVDGVAKVEGWEFIATIEHTEGGNILRTFNDDISIPLKYRSVSQHCDHCNTNRDRKDTYILYNAETNEWKQIGRNCLRDFTGGFDALSVASALQGFYSSIRDLEGIDEDDFFYYGSSSYNTPYSVYRILLMAKAVVDEWGFVKSTDYDGYRNENSTKNWTKDLCDSVDETDKKVGELRPTNLKLQKELDAIGYLTFDTVENRKFVDDAIDWIKSQDMNTSTNFISNLMVLVNKKYCNARDIGYLVALIPTYQKQLDKEEKSKKADAEKMVSNYVGNIGDKIEIAIADCRLLTSFVSDYGWVGIYKFEDADGNVYTWKTSKDINTDGAIGKTVKGTIKNHNEYRGVKQTELTRCKIL